jgi:uroporphyrinogen III methyltransferase / synthase
MTKPLTGKTIVITRAAAQADEFVTALEEFGASVIVCPLIEIAEPESYEQLDEALAHLYGYDWIIFTSANGVRFFLQRLVHQGLSVADLDDVRVCAIGEATAEHLREAQVHVDLVAEKSRAEGLFEALSNFVGGPEKVAGLNFLLPRAATGREYLPSAIETAGARVDVVTAYRTVLPPDIDRGKLGAMLTGSADCIAFTSSSTVKNFALLFDSPNLKPVLGDLVVACIGDVTATTAHEYGLQVAIQPNETTVKSLAHAIAEYFVD